MHWGKNPARDKVTGFANPLPLLRYTSTAARRGKTLMSSTATAMSPSPSPLKSPAATACRMYLAALKPIRCSGKKLPDPRLKRNDSDGPSSPASFAVSRSRTADDCSAAARTPIGDPSTAYVPGRPKRGIAQPGGATAAIAPAQMRQWSDTHLMLGTPQHSRIHEDPNHRILGWAAKVLQDNFTQVSG